MVSQSSYGSIIWFLNQKMVFPKDGFLKNLVNYMFPNQTSAFSRYSATDSIKCASTTDSSCFRTIIECITSYDSSVWFKLIVYKVKYSICCFKTLRYLLLIIFVCFSIYALLLSIFIISPSNGIFIWFLNQKMVFPKDGFLKNLVNYMFPNQTSAFSRYSATDSIKCASTTDSSCFRTIIECITSYDSSVWFKLIVYKVKYSICCFKTLRYLLLIIFVCFSIYALLLSIFIISPSNGILPTNKYWSLFMWLIELLII